MRRFLHCDLNGAFVLDRQVFIGTKKFCPLVLLLLLLQNGLNRLAASQKKALESARYLRRPSKKLPPGDGGRTSVLSAARFKGSFSSQ